MGDRIAVMREGRIVQCGPTVGALRAPRRPVRRPVHRVTVDERPRGDRGRHARRPGAARRCAVRGPRRCRRGAAAGRAPARRPQGGVRRAARGVASGRTGFARGERVVQRAARPRPARARDDRCGEREAHGAAGRGPTTERRRRSSWRWVGDRHQRLGAADVARSTRARSTCSISRPAPRCAETGSGGRRRAVAPGAGGEAGGPGEGLAAVDRRPATAASLRLPPPRRGPTARSPTAGRCACTRCGSAASSSASATGDGERLAGLRATRLTRPMRSASAPSTPRPVRIRSIARLWPMRRGRRIVPRSTSGTPKRRQ